MSNHAPRHKSLTPTAAPSRGRRRASARAPLKIGIPSAKAAKARRKFLRMFPGGFRDETYVAWERDYKWQAHLRWQEALAEAKFRELIAAQQFEQIAAVATRIESRTNLLFSFEKMALRDAVRTPEGARAFALALFDLLHGDGPMETRFNAWVKAVGDLPRLKTRVLTWPMVTVFGFIAQPKLHFFLKPTVTREAARRHGVELPYASRPSWPHYKALLDFVGRVRADIRELRPRDMIDMQSFLWVQGSDEYPD
jgi:hypothetical protein